MTSSTSIRAWVEWMRASGTPSTTVGLRRYYVGRLADDHRGRSIVGLGVDDLIRWLAAHPAWAPNTRKSVRSSLRCYYGWLAMTGVRASSPAHQLPPVRVPRGRAKPTPERAYRAALIEADDRARLAITLAGQCGLRRAEIAAVHTDNVEDDLLGSSLRVVGKGGHTRIVPLTDDLAGEICSRPPGWLFPSPRGGHLTPAHLARVVTAALQAGSTHGLRHRCATVAYAKTKNLRAVQELLGHQRPETTAVYIDIPADDIREAMLAAAA